MERSRSAVRVEHAAANAHGPSHLASPGETDGNFFYPDILFLTLQGQRTAASVSWNEKINGCGLLQKCRPSKVHRPGTWCTHAQRALAIVKAHGCHQPLISKHRTCLVRMTTTIMVYRLGELNISWPSYLSPASLATMDLQVPSITNIAHLPNSTAVILPLSPRRNHMIYSSLRLQNNVCSTRNI
jgi:hypothetical protein